MNHFLKRLLFCLPFVVIVFYIHGYHGELINNTSVYWQYVKNKEGKIYLALDVYSPSGIRIESIYSDGKDVTAFWRLANYPDWYKGKKNFKKLDEFQEELHPYLPYNEDFNILYTNGSYTFLYEWVPESSLSLPPESFLKIKYQNVSTQNFYSAEHVLGIRLISNIVKSAKGRPVIDFDMLYPASISQEYILRNKPDTAFDNLIPNNPSGYMLTDLKRNDYAISLFDRNEQIIDSLKGVVRWDKSGAYQVHTKASGHYTFQEGTSSINFSELLRHVAAVIFMVYFVIACWYVGIRFIKWRAIVLDTHAEKIVIPVFLGIIGLTYLFFIIGMLKLLYFHSLFVILSAILFFGFEYSEIIRFKNISISILRDEIRKIKDAPWRTIFLTILAAMLFYNFSYCFIPATYIDGSGDIENSYLPTLNHYIISHSFEADINNSTTGTSSQTLDILRTVAKIFIGEPGVYLLSFAYLILVLGGIYLIGKENFEINTMLIYLTGLLFLSADNFTVGIHFGKLQIAALSFLLISLYSVRFSEHSKNYILPPLFFAFLVSQYIHFVLIALAYYFFIGIYSYYRCKTIRAPLFKLHAASFTVFSLLSFVFPLKLIFEVGTFFPPGMAPAWLADFFLKFNQDNDMYKYIDNAYIRNFYKHWFLADFGNPINLTAFINSTKELFKSFDSSLILLSLLFSPFFLRLNKYRVFYIYETVILIIVLIIIFPSSTYTGRIKIFYMYPLIIFQFVVIDDFMSKFNKRPFVFYRILKTAFILGIIFIIFFEISSAGIKFRQHKIFINFGSIRHQYNHTYGSIFKTWYNEALPVFLGKAKYQYLKTVPKDISMFETAEGGAERYFDHAMLIRQYTDFTDRILIVPVRFHAHTMRHITARHALGSVIYQRDINKIMADLKKLNINYLSVLPINYKDYNPFYTPIFEDAIFYKYFKLLFSSNGSRFYKVIHDGSNIELTHSPYDVRGLPFIPIYREDQP